MSITSVMKRKAAEPAEPVLSEYQTAKARWAEIDGKFRELVEREEGIKLAVSLAKSPDEKRVPQHLRDRAAPFMKLAQGRMFKRTRVLEALEDEILELAPKRAEESELWQQARRAETSRIALELQPRHRAAVKKIAALIENLSRAMEVESDVRAELARTAPEPESGYLPNCIGGLNFGMLSEWGSPASQWAQGMRQLKILE